MRPVPGRFAYVVKQQRAEQQRGLFHFRQQIGVTLDGRLAGSAQARQNLQRHQRVLVHRVAMIEVAYDQAFDLRHFGEDGAQHAGIVHAPRGLGGVGQRKDLLQRRPDGPRRGKPNF